MNRNKDRLITCQLFFLIGLAALLLLWGILFFKAAGDGVKDMFLYHDSDMVSSLLDQGVSEAVIARAVTASESTREGWALLDKIGMDRNTDIRLIDRLASLYYRLLPMAAVPGVIFIFLLFAGSFVFIRRREKLYEQAIQTVGRFMEGDFTRHLAGMEEGTIYRLFASVDQLATALQSHNEKQQKARQFLKDTISDISHQLKTPLAALMMYNEIITEEASDKETVQNFGEKSARAIDRMQQLIQAMLKITRLDAGSIVFEKKRCRIHQLAEHAISELSARAFHEGKEIILDGKMEDEVICDFEWTAEALGNLVKNSLDHTDPGAVIRIRWESSPVVTRIILSDNGRGVAEEDIHHIFKRFYRSRNSLDKQGIGLGLSLVKSIVEGQGGVVSVRSITVGNRNTPVFRQSEDQKFGSKEWENNNPQHNLNETMTSVNAGKRSMEQGTTFILSFLTEM